MNLDDSTIRFYQDTHLSFEPVSHTYSVDGVVTLQSVTQVVHSFFKAFDANYWSLRKCDGDATAAARLRDEWSCKAHFASHVGTHLHAQIERYLTSGASPILDCEIVYEGSHVHEHRTINIAKEWEMFLAFHRAAHYRPFRAEWSVYDMFSRIAGTIDLICSREDGTYALYDWKRSNKIIPNQVNVWSHGMNGLEHLSDTPYVHYCLQQNLYRYILEKNYGLSISGMYLIVLHPLGTTDASGFVHIPPGHFGVIEVPVMSKEVSVIINRRLSSSD